MNPNRKKLESLAWKYTHRDYKGRIDGVRCVNQMVPGVGTCSVPLASLTDEQLLAKIPSAIRATL